MFFFSAVLVYTWAKRFTGKEVFAFYKDRPRPKQFIRPNSSEKRLKRSLRASVADARVNSNSLAQENRAKLLEGVAG